MKQILDPSQAISALERISDGVICLNLQGEITYINKAVFHLFGLKEEDQEQLFQKECFKEIKYNMMQAINQMSEIHFEVQCSVKWIEVDVYPASDGITVLFSDWTSRKKVERTIAEKQEKLILLSEATSHLFSKKEPKEILDALFKELAEYLDLNVYFNYIYEPSRNNLRLMNYSGIPKQTAEEIQWLNFGEAVCGCVARDCERIVVYDIDRSDDVRVQLVKGFGIKAYACHPLISYGKLIGTLSFGSSKRSSFSDAELELLYTICNQVASTLDRAFLIAELTLKKEEAEKANRSKTEFISMISHELRTPLNSIIGFSQILEGDSRDPLSIGQKEKVQKVLKASRHLLALFNGIINTIKLDTNHLPLNREYINMETVVLECMKMITPIADSKDMKITNLIEETPPLKTDATKVTQVMLNLLENAVKYTQEKGQITLSAQLENNHLKVVISDSGIGIPVEELEKIFAPFYRIFNDELNIEGAGMGLAIVKQLVYQIGGKVGAYSVPGKGSSFWFTLPMEEDDK